MYSRHGRELMGCRSPVCESCIGNPPEPPGADLHAGWCGDWGGKTPGYPISWRDDASSMIVRRSLHFLQRRQYVCAAIHLFFGLIHAHHEEKALLRRGQPVHLLVFAGRVVLDVEGQ